MRLILRPYAPTSYLAYLAQDARQLEASAFGTGLDGDSSKIGAGNVYLGEKIRVQAPIYTRVNCCQQYQISPYPHPKKPITYKIIQNSTNSLYILYTY